MNIFSDDDNDDNNDDWQWKCTSKTLQKLDIKFNVEMLEKRRNCARAYAFGISYFIFRSFVGRLYVRWYARAHLRSNSLIRSLGGSFFFFSLFLVRSKRTLQCIARVRFIRWICRVYWNWLRAGWSYIFFCSKFAPNSDRRFASCLDDWPNSIRPFWSVSFNL